MRPRGSVSSFDVSCAAFALVALSACGAAEPRVEVHSGGCTSVRSESVGPFSTEGLGALASVRYALARVSGGGSLVEQRGDTVRSWEYATLEVSAWRDPAGGPRRVALVALVGEEGPRGRGDAPPDPVFRRACGHPGEELSFALRIREDHPAAAALEVPIAEALAVGDADSFRAPR